MNLPQETLGFRRQCFSHCSRYSYRHSLYCTVHQCSRSEGYGKGLLQHLARIAVQRGCGRLEWNCLDWNQPSIEFYLSLGAEKMDCWTTYRLEGDTLEELAAQLPR